MPLVLLFPPEEPPRYPFPVTSIRLPASITRLPATSISIFETCFVEPARAVIVELPVTVRLLKYARPSILIVFPPLRTKSVPYRSLRSFGFVPKTFFSSGSITPSPSVSARQGLVMLVFTS